MSDERIVRALRQGPPDEPTYHSSVVRRALAAPVRATVRQSRPAVRLAAGSFQLAAASVIAVVLLAGFLYVREQAHVGATPSPSATHVPSDLLDQARRNGFIRFAIRPDFPQAAISGLQGFDVDVANELATRLALAEYPVQLTVDKILGSGRTDPWDLGLPSAGLNADEVARFATTDPYYYWPAYLVVPKASSATSSADLVGQTICVTGGSPGEAWLGGHLDPIAGPADPPPASPVVHTESTDWACLDALTNGTVDAIVTTNLSDSDLAARPSLRTVGGPLFIEPRAIVAARAGLDPSALLSAIDDALGAMRSDGTLADLSRNRFGGRDLTTPPSS